MTDQNIYHISGKIKMEVFYKLRKLQIGIPEKMIAPEMRKDKNFNIVLHDNNGGSTVYLYNCRFNGLSLGKWQVKYDNFKEVTL